jgi:outer membrane lipoprotein carrier protein
MIGKGIVVAALAVLGLTACGGAEQGEGRQDAPGRAATETPAPAPGAVPAPGADAEADAGRMGSDDASGPRAGAPAGAGTPAPPATPSAPSAGATPSPGETPADAAEILRRVERTYADVRSMRADFVQSLTVPLLGSTQRSEGQLFQRQPDRFLMRFTDPAGDVMVADGRHFWLYTPSVDPNQVIRARIAEGGAPVDLHQQFLSNPNQRFVATLTGTEQVDGRATHALSLVPRGSSPYRLIRIWVDQRDNLVRRFEMTEENGSVRRLDLRNLRLNAEIDESVFRFSPPAGAQIFDQ